MNYNFDAKLDAQGIFSAAITGQLLADSSSKQVRVKLMDQQQVIQQHSHNYQVDLNHNTAQTLDVDIRLCLSFILLQAI